MQKTYRIGIMCDCQYTDADNEIITIQALGIHSDRHYRQSIDKLRHAVAAYNEADVDAIFHLGDLADRSHEDYAPLYPILQAADAPIYHVIGNHDYQACEHDRAQVLKALGLTSPYYSVLLGAIRFIILDSNECGVIDRKPTSPEYAKREAAIERLHKEGNVGAYSWNGGISKPQLAWLEAELESATRRYETIIVMAHHPVFPPNSHNMLNADEVLTLLQRYPIAAFLNGHNHAGNYGERDGVPYVTFPGMIEGDEDAYSIAEVEKGCMRISGYGTHTSYVLPLRDAL